MKRLVLAAVAVLAGCASMWAPLNQRVAAMRGQPIGDAIRTFGIPDKEYDVAGKKAYAWVVSVPDPEGKTTLTCTLKAMAADGIVERADIDGSNGPCLTFLQRARADRG